AEAAIAAGDYILSADQIGVARDALRNQLGMLDEIRFRLDHARYQDLAIRQLYALEDSPFMRVARVGGLERDRHGFCRKDEVDDVGERHVALLRTFIVDPAKAHAQLFGRNACDGMIERLDVELRALAEFRQAPVRVLDVAPHTEIRAVDL